MGVGRRGLKKEEWNAIKAYSYNKTIEFMFAGINMFWARLRLILAQAVRRGLKIMSSEKGPKYIYAQEH